MRPYRLSGSSDDRPVFSLNMNDPCSKVEETYDKAELIYDAQYALDVARLTELERIAVIPDKRLRPVSVKLSVRILFTSLGKTHSQALEHHLVDIRHQSPRSL